MSGLLEQLPGYALAHLQLSLFALACGAALSVPLGIAVARRPRLEPLVLGVAGVLQTIPGLALLALMVPLLAAASAVAQRWLGFELRSIGFLPAWIALTLYSVLPMLRNTVTGIRGVDPALVEAARGVGMTDRQRLWQVELPLALPVVVAGVRTATVWVVGTATLATPVGATSLGNFIFAGLQTRNFASVVVGSVAAAALALGLDALVRAIERGVLRARHAAVRHRHVGWALPVAALGALLVASLVLSAGGLRERERPVVIGAKTFTEQYVLAELIGALVHARTGAPVERVDSLGSTVAFDALRNDQIDVYVDYSGTIWATILRRTGLPADRARVLAEVREALLRDHGITVAAVPGFENTYAIAMREAQARALGIARIGELARHARSLVFGADYEFLARPEWAALRERYGLRFRELRSMDPALLYAAVASGELDAISAFSTDGRIEAYGLRVLEDEQGVIPPYDAIVLVGPRLARERPEVVEALAWLDGRIPADAMRAMNRAVDLDGRAPAEVARAFLARAGVVGAGGR